MPDHLEGVNTVRTQRPVRQMAEAGIRILVRSSATNAACYHFYLLCESVNLNMFLRLRCPTRLSPGVRHPPPPAVRTHLAEEVFPVDPGCGVALELHLGRGGLQWLCLRDTGDFMVGAFDPVAPKLGQQDEGEGSFSPQDLK